MDYEPCLMETNSSEDNTVPQFNTNFVGSIAYYFN